MLIVIRYVSQTPNQHFRMITEGSRDTEFIVDVVVFTIDHKDEPKRYYSSAPDGQSNTGYDNRHIIKSQVGSTQISNLKTEACKALLGKNRATVVYNKEHHMYKSLITSTSHLSCLTPYKDSSFSLKAAGTINVNSLH